MRMIPRDQCADRRDGEAKPKRPLRGDSGVIEPAGPQPFRPRHPIEQALIHSEKPALANRYRDPASRPIVSTVQRRRPRQAFRSARKNAPQRCTCEYNETKEFYHGLDQSPCLCKNSRNRHRSSSRIPLVEPGSAGRNQRGKQRNDLSDAGPHRREGIGHRPGRMPHRQIWSHEEDASSSSGRPSIAASPSWTTAGTTTTAQASCAWARRWPAAIATRFF